jgi:hypothetical protein
MAKYIILRDYRAQWNAEQDIYDDAKWIVDDAEIARLSTEWGIGQDALVDQVQDIDAFVEELKQSKYEYTEYCDDFSRYKYETNHNNRIDAIIDSIRMEAQS